MAESIKNLRTYHFILWARRAGALGVSQMFNAERTAANVEAAQIALCNEFDHIETLTCTRIDTATGTGKPYLADARDGGGLLLAGRIPVPTGGWPEKQLPCVVGLTVRREFPQRNVWVMAETDGFHGVMRCALRWDGELWFNRDGKPVDGCVYSFEDCVHHNRREYTPTDAPEAPEVVTLSREEYLASRDR